MSDDSQIPYDVAPTEDGLVVLQIGENEVRQIDPQSAVSLASDLQEAAEQAHEQSGEET